MEGLRSQFGAKLGPLPVWAWALLAVLAVLGWMYFTKSGFFGAPSDSTPGAQDTSGDQGVGSGALPLGLAGLAGAGNTTSPNVVTNPVTAFYDPTTGSYMGQSSSSAGTSSTPTTDLSSQPAGAVTVPVIGASYQVPVAQQSYEPSGAGGLTAGQSYQPSSSGSTILPSVGGGGGGNFVP